MSALADRVAKTPAKKDKTGQTFSAWGPIEIKAVSDLESGKTWTDNHVYPLNDTRDYAKVTGAYNAYASAFSLCSKALAASDRTDVSTFFRIDVKSVQDGVKFTIVAK